MKMHSDLPEEYKNNKNIKQRICLVCDKEFESKGAFNRCCPTCTNLVDRNLSIYVESHRSHGMDLSKLSKVTKQRLFKKMR